MKRLAFGSLALATALALSSVASAASIVGTLGIGGGNDVWTATGITFNNPAATARDATGDYALVLGAAPSTAAATIDATTFSFASPDVLFVTVGTSTATLTVTGPLDVSLNNGEFLNLSGTGFLTLAGFAPTVDTFSIDSTDSSGNAGATGSSTFGFDFVADASTPEPSSLFLLGTGLLAFAGTMRRKLFKVQAASC
jgi:hypothetical protein